MLHKRFWLLTVLSALAPAAYCGPTAFQMTLGWDWTFNGQTLGSTAGAVAVDPAGNSYSFFRLNSASGARLNLVRLSGFGDLSYTKSILLPLAGEAKGVIVDANHNATVFAHNYKTMADCDLLFVHYDSVGVEKWRGGMGGAAHSTDTFVNAATDALGNIHLIANIQNAPDKHITKMREFDINGALLHDFTITEIAPEQAFFANGRWYVSGADNLAGSKGGARWACYNPTSGAHLFGETQANTFSSNTNTQHTHQFIVHPVADGSVYVAHNFFHQAGGNTPTLAFQLKYLNAAGSQNWLGDPYSGSVLQLDGGDASNLFALGQMNGSMTSRQFVQGSDVQGHQAWRMNDISCRKIRANTQGFFTAGFDTNSFILVSHFSPQGNFQGSQNYTGVAGGINLIGDCALVNGSFYCSDSLHYTGGTLVNTRRFIPGPVLNSLTTNNQNVPPNSDVTFLITCSLSAPAGGLKVFVNTKASWITFPGGATTGYVTIPQGLNNTTFTLHTGPSSGSTQITGVEGRQGGSVRAIAVILS
jgi:hypothetical protein